MIKKAISILLALCTIIGIIPIVSLSASAATLKDVLKPELYVKANNSAGLDTDVKVAITSTVLNGTLYLPGGSEPSKLYFSWDDSELILKSGTKTYTSGTAPVADDGKAIKYTVVKGKRKAIAKIETMVGSDDVKPMYLNLDESLGTIEAMNEDETHETSCYGSAGFDADSYFISIKGRGNSTWTVYPKKPYNLTFYKKADYDKKKNVELIEGVEAKKWSLLACYMDSSYLRNKIAFDLASELGIGIESEFVDLWMNGEYLGLYLLTPKNDYQAPEDGYVLENDNYVSSDDPQFLIDGMKESGMNAFGLNEAHYNRITIKNIGNGAAEAGETPKTIEAWFSKAWDALRDYNTQEYRKYFDVDSWAKMYLMYEVSKNYDAFSGSLLMHRDGTGEDDLLYAGPVWDYDISFGRTVPRIGSGVSLTNQLNAQGRYIDSIGLLVETEYVSLLQEFGKHEDFVEKMSEIYNEYKYAFEGITDNIENNAVLIADSVVMDENVWGVNHFSGYFVAIPLVFGTGKYKLRYHVTNSWNAYVDNLHEYVEKRVMYMSDHLTVNR